jgi:hypothetical protein
VYTDINFRSKKALKDALARGDSVTVFRTDAFGNTPRPGEKIYLSGPHFPEPHRWYATAVIGDDGAIKPGSVK